MSREIKFRAWKMHNGKMSRCIYTPVSIMHYAQTHLDEPVMKHSGENNIRNFMPDADIIEQYIGLEDRNGKEIYEGDIVRVHHDDMLHDYNQFSGDNVLVERSLSKGGAFIIRNWYGERIIGWDIPLMFIEVIGNIHENKELLGGEE